MNVYVFQSKREGQNTDTFTKILIATTSPGALNLFKFFLNGIADLDSLTPIGTFTNPTPVLTGTAAVTPSDTTAVIKGLSIDVLGHIYAAAITTNEAPATFDSTDIRK